MSFSVYHSDKRHGTIRLSKAQFDVSSGKTLTSLNFILLAVLLASPLGNAQTEYTGDGVPTNNEEELRWLINRARFNPAAENSARGTAYGDVSVKPPLAPSGSLILAGRHHSQDLAEKNVFSHNTVTNSRFYNWQLHQSTTTVQDFTERATDEGYAFSGGAENLNAGATTPAACFLNWWTSSSGHRANLFETGSIRKEIGLGYFRSTNIYVHYYTMISARSNTDTGFFTDTIFRDLNSNSTYNEGEGMAGIRVELELGGVLHGNYDVSAAAGNFAVPYSAIATAATPYVYLTNTTAAAVTLAIPNAYATQVSVPLAAGQRIRLGSFIRPSDANMGFRNMTIAPASVPNAPQVTISTTSSSAVLSWPSESGIKYTVQWSATLAAPWNSLTPTPLNGTGAVLVFTDPTSPASLGRRFYRVIASSE